MGWAPRCASAIGCAAFPVGCGWDAFLLLFALVELQLPKTKALEDARGPSAASSSQAFSEVFLLLLVVHENFSFTWIQVSQLLEESWTILTTAFDLVVAVGRPLKNQVAISPFTLPPALTRGWGSFWRPTR